MGVVFGILVLVFMWVLIFFAADKNDDKEIIEEKKEEIKVETKSRNKANEMEKAQIFHQMKRNIFNFFSYEEVLSEVGGNNHYTKYKYDEEKEEIVSCNNLILWRHNGKIHYNEEAINPQIFYEETISEIKRRTMEFCKYARGFSLFDESPNESPVEKLVRERYDICCRGPRKYYNGYVIKIRVLHEDYQSLNEAKKKREVYEHIHPEVKRNRLLKEQNELLKRDCKE